MIGCLDFRRSVGECATPQNGAFVLRGTLLPRIIVPRGTLVYFLGSAREEVPLLLSGGAKMAADSS